MLDTTVTATELAPGIVLHTIETPSIGNRSYLVEQEGWAVAIDVERDVQRFADIVEQRGLHLGAVAETHLHNDYLSGGWALARRVGGEYLVPSGPAYSMPARATRDTETVEAGPIRVLVLETPGHTDAHQTLVVLDARGEPVGAFTGGSWLIGGAGRTDLMGEQNIVPLTRAQYRSIRRLGGELPDATRVLPTHGFGSSCLAGPLELSSGDTVGDQKASSMVFRVSEEEYLEAFVRGSGPIPPYYPSMAPRNVHGPDAWAPPTAPALSPTAATASGATIIDVRPWGAFERGHLPGSIAMPATGAVARWAGWQLPVGTPYVLVADSEQVAEDAHRDLARIGFDEVQGIVIADELDAETVAVDSAPFSALAQRQRAGTAPVVLDVRADDEWRLGHVVGAVHRPAQTIEPDAQLADEPVWVYCASGYRAGLVGSLVAREGGAVTVIAEAVDAAPGSGVDWCFAADCPDDRCTASATEPTVSR
ncbi:rhodanese-like domain-containing protein [Microcella humidisoli]|uniref:MBL fold metallo-hydrolase n=1 Tax=Microcella humidisoli TaxID=2963406 RepID=A0ABY5FVH0_9MICO|nr:MBL fold metallo-hydrolase [Microcella humidisoli]UTT61895.1 MBL fold metallo-hydrolase [Microcella humidisoli]